MSIAEGQVHLRWRTVALVAVVIALTASVLIAIVSAIREVDALSVIALALAVIAFVVQIIVYIAQADSAAKQQIQASEVYGKTLSALATIEEKAEGTRTTVNTLSDRLLDAAIGKAIPEAESEGAPVTSEEFAETVSRIVKEILNASSHSGPKSASPRPSLRVADDTMRTLPPKDRQTQLLDLIEPLGDAQLNNLNRLAVDQARSGGNNGPNIGPGVRAINPYAAKELFDAGLVVRRKVPWSSTPVFQLTDLGKEAGRMLLADLSGQETDNRLVPLRARYDTYRTRMSRESDPEEMYKDFPITK